MDTNETYGIINLIHLYFVVIYLLYFHTDNGKDVKNFTNASERVDDNGVKYIVYEENPVEFDEDTEVNFLILIFF